MLVEFPFMCHVHACVQQYLLPIYRRKYTAVLRLTMQGVMEGVMHRSGHDLASEMGAEKIVPRPGQVYSVQLAVPTYSANRYNGKCLWSLYVPGVRVS